MANKTAKTSKVLKKTAAERAKPAKKVAKPAARSVATTKKPEAKPVVKDPESKPVAHKTAEPRTESMPVRKSTLDEKTLNQLKDALIKMRDRLTGQITAQSDDSLKYIDDTSSEDRTDDFDKEFALNLVSSEHDTVYEINNALRRISDGVYGCCDGCGCMIEKPRLQALPFARMCIRCQSEQEKGRTRFRPFGDTLAQGVDQAPEITEPEETE
jgi:RNA polymerase-binding transcription factor DksA